MRGGAAVAARKTTSTGSASKQKSATITGEVGRPNQSVAAIRGNRVL